MDSGILDKEKNEIEQNINSTENVDQAEIEIDQQINTLASVIIEILLKDIS
jgi:hypothetical protein